MIFSSLRFSLFFDSDLKFHIFLSCVNTKLLLLLTILCLCLNLYYMLNTTFLFSVSNQKSSPAMPSNNRWLNPVLSNHLKQTTYRRSTKLFSINKSDYKIHTPQIPVASYRILFRIYPIS